MEAVVQESGELTDRPPDRSRTGQLPLKLDTRLRHKLAAAGGKTPLFREGMESGRELAEAGSPILRHIFAAGRHPKWLEVPPHKFGWQPIPANVPNNEYSLLLVSCPGDS